MKRRKKERASTKVARRLKWASFGLFGVAVILLVMLFVQSFDWSAVGQEKIPDPTDPSKTIVVRVDSRVEKMIERERELNPDNPKLATASSDTRTFTTRGYTNYAKKTGPWMPLSGLTLWFWGFTLKWCVRPAAEAASISGYMIGSIIAAIICLAISRKAREISRRQPKESRGGDDVPEAMGHRSGSWRSRLAKLNPFKDTGDMVDDDRTRRGGSMGRRRRVRRGRRRQRSQYDDEG